MSTKTVESILLEMDNDNAFLEAMREDTYATIESFQTRRKIGVKDQLTEPEKDLLYRMMYSIRAQSTVGQEYIRRNFLDKLLGPDAAVFLRKRASDISVKCVGDGASMRWWGIGPLK